MISRRGSRRPPRLAEWLLARSAPACDRDAMLGDLAEEWASHVLPERGRSRAALWYWLQVLSSLAPNLVRRLRRLGGTRPSLRGDSMLTTLRQDLRYATRIMRRRPGFATVVIATLALGIAASTIVYSVVDGVVLNPFPFPEPARLVGVGPEFPRLNQKLSFMEVLSPAEYLDVERQSATLERVVAWDMGNRQIAGSDAPQNVFTAFWWGDALATLEMRPALGRGLRPDETLRGDRVAVISHRLWRQRFGSAPTVIGEKISISGEPYTIVGVMPSRTLIYGTDLWIPMGVDPAVFPRNGRQFQLLARLAAGVSLEMANAELATIARRVEQEHGAALEEYAGWRLVAQTWTSINVSMLRPAALILLGAVGFVLLLVCVNVSSLVLARAVGRRQEFAVRLALGAARGRILRQLLTESVLLALVGGALGVALAWMGVRALAAGMAVIPLPVPGEIALNGRVLAVTVFVSVAAGVLFGLAPALQASRPDLQGTLRAEGGASVGGRARHRLQRAFVGIEVALALVLLAAGGLLVHSFIRLQRVDPGFDSRDLLTMRLTLPRGEYDEAGIRGFFALLTERVRAIPGVRSVGVGTQFPPMTFMRYRIGVEGGDAAGSDALPTAYVTLVDDGYFRTLGVRLLRGRVPGAGDTERTPLVAVVNEEAARQLSLGADPLGRRLRVGESRQWAEVVGIVGSVKNAGLDRNAEPEIYGSMHQALGGNNQLFLLVRTERRARGVLPAIRSEVAALDADQPIYAVQTVDDAFATSAAPRRLATFALALFGAFALLLAAVGIYGVAAHAVSERTREIGLRIALGANADAVRKLVLAQTLLPVSLGVGVGLLAALALGRLMSGLLFGIGGNDPATIAAVAVILGAAALTATWLPARRATRLDPLLALRAE